jgi:hypothetical protein
MQLPKLCKGGNATPVNYQNQESMSKFQLFHIYNSIQEVKIMSRRCTQVIPFSFFKKEEKKGGGRKNS